MQLPESGGKQRHRQHSTASTLSRGMAAVVASDTKTRFSLIGGGRLSASHRFHTSRTHRDYVCCDGVRRHKTNNGRSPCELIVGLRYMPCIICIRSGGWWLLCAMETIFIGSHGGSPPRPPPLSAFELSRYNCLKLCSCFAQKCHPAESAV